MNDRQVHLELESRTHRVCEIGNHPSFRPATRAQAGKTSGSTLRDFAWFWLPINFRLAVENIYRSVNWWGLFVLCMCLLSCTLMTIGIFGATATDLSVLTDLLGFR